MNETKTTARKAGALYFVFMIIAIIREFLFPTFVVVGDAAATAHNIAGAELTYRIGNLLSFATLVIFIYLVALLYKLFRDVDKGHALVMVLLVCVGVAVSLANLLYRFVPLVILGGSDYLSVFTQAQLDALMLASQRLASAGAAVSTAFWGLWLFPFGMLAIKSGFFPRILGILLIVAGVGYVITSFTSMVLPDYISIVSKIMMPLYFGEVPIIFYMMIKGAKVPQPQAVTT